LLSDVYEKIDKGSKKWEKMKENDGKLYKWDK
jgi:hypothetical protein